MTRLLAAAVLLLPLNLHSADGPGAQLPPLDAQGMVMPLTEDLLTPQERQVFNGLPPASAQSEDRARFLYSRGYLRYCQRVVAGQMPPLELPPLPARRNWNRGYLSAEEARDILDVALGMKLMARMNQPATGRPA